MPRVKGRPMTHLFYVINARFPSEQAHPLQVAQMCEAFSRLPGINVTLIHPHRRRPRPHEGEWSLARGVHSRALPTIDWLPLAGRFGRIESAAFLLQYLTFYVSVVRYFLRTPPSHRDIFYTKDPGAFLFIPWLKRRWACRAVAEVHYLLSYGRAAQWRALADADRVIVMNPRGMASASKHIPRRKLVLVPNGVDLGLFSGRPAPILFESTPPPKPWLTYAGQLLHWKGSSMLKALAAANLPGSLVLAGGTPPQVAAFRKALPPDHRRRVTILGYRPHTETASLLRQSDVLLLPLSDAEPRWSEFSSPLKLFDYLAAARPIVASSSPVFEGILRHRHNAILLPSDDPRAWAKGIRSLLADPTLRRRLSGNAGLAARRFSWNRRAGRVLQGLV